MSIFSDSIEGYPAIVDAVDAGTPAIGAALGLPFRPAEGMADPEEHVQSLHSSRVVKPQSVHLRDWNFKHPTLSLDARAVVDNMEGPALSAAPPSSPRSYMQLPADADGAAAIEGLDAKKLEVYIHHGEYDEPEVQRELAKLALEQVRRRLRKFTGTSNCRRLAAGHRFSVFDHPVAQLDREYVVLRVEHRGEVPENRPGAGERPRPVYENRFVAGASTVVHRPPRPPRTHQQVLESAIVVGPAGEEIYTDSYGRVKVQFHWDREGQKNEYSSCWMRVVTAWAGTGFGVQYVPRVGMEVMVSFLGGDKDRPVIVGCVANQTHPVPFTLPLAKTVSGVRTQSTPGARGYNELSFEDAAGGEAIRLRSERDIRLEAGNDALTNVQHDHRTAVGGQCALDVTGSLRTIVGGTDVRAVAGPVVTRVGGDERRVIDGFFDLRVAGRASTSMDESRTHVRGNQSVRVEGSAMTSVGTQEREEVISVTVNGSELHEATKSIALRSPASIVLECGSSSITLSPDAIFLRSKDVIVKGTKSVVLAGKGPTLELTDKLEACAETMRLYAQGASAELGDSAIKLDAAQVTLGTDPETDTIELKDPTVPTKKLKWRFFDGRRAPFAGKKYRLLTQGLRATGTTTDDGTIDLDVPETAVVADVTLWERDFPNGPRRQYTIRLGDLPPATSVAGAQLRLQNLGYYCGAPADEMTAELAHAIFAFQSHHGLPPTGEVDGPTSAKLAELHPEA